MHNEGRRRQNGGPFLYTLSLYFFDETSFSGYIPPQTEYPVNWRNTAVINKRKLWATVLASWGFTLMGLFNIIFMCILATALASRVLGPEAIVVFLMPAFALMFIVFMSGEVIVNIMMNAEAPDPVRDKRYLDAVAAVSKKARMLIRPRPWVLSIGDKPNAMAYGPGLPFMAAVGVSRKLVDMLEQDELEAVLAHEFGHIRCRDIGILSVISLILGLINKLRGALTARGSVLAQNPVVILVGWAIYLLGRIATYVSQFSISQERELAADALSAAYMRTPEPLIRALTKLNSLRDDTEPKKAKRSRHMFEDLMVSHPGLDERIRSLNALTA